MNRVNNLLKHPSDRDRSSIQIPLVAHALAVAIGAFSTVSMAQTRPPPNRSNYFHDPFGPATQGLAGCPVPSGPLLSQDEVKQKEHDRVERGTSCYRSGQCRLPNSYLYDKEIFPRAVKFIQNDSRFDDTSIWLVVQRRWVFLQGCVRSEEQGRALEAAVRDIDDVGAVIGQWMVGTSGTPPYEQRTH